MARIIGALCLLAPTVAFVPASLRGNTFARRAPRAAGRLTMMAAEPSKKILVVGGDGFCGWPTALHLSDAGHEVTILDNLSRRKIDLDLGCDSLTPISSMETRLEAWKEVSGGKEIGWVNMDVSTQYQELENLLRAEQFDTVIHFGEQRAAPYSMKDQEKKRYTIDNNLGGTHNLLCAIVESEADTHVVHLGTMGVYGYGTSGGEIPEGYINVILPGGRESKILHPAYPGSIYHATKVLDATLFQFYNKNDGVRVTDLHQGIVWGTNTALTASDPRLVNRFDYDGDYGTVLNRFLMQSALGIPLTVYGTGGQTRALIHVMDTAKCIEIAVNNPPAEGEPVEIFNQVAETRRVRDLAQMISDMTGCGIKNVPNPRQEAAENDLEVSNEKFRTLGFEPTKLDEGLFAEVREITDKYKDRCVQDKVLPSSFWNKKRVAAQSMDAIEGSKDQAQYDSDLAAPSAVAAGSAPLSQ